MKDIKKILIEKIKKIDFGESMDNETKSKMVDWFIKELDNMKTVKYHECDHYYVSDKFDCFGFCLEYYCIKCGLTKEL